MSAVVCTKCGALTVAQCQCVQLVGIVPGNIYDQQLPENIIAELQSENARLRLALTEAETTKREYLELKQSVARVREIGTDKIEITGSGIELFAKSCIDWFAESKGENFVTSTVDDRRSGVSYDLIMQKVGAKPVSVVLDELRSSITEAKAQVKKDIIELLDRYEIIDGKIRAEIEAL